MDDARQSLPSDKLPSGSLAPGQTESSTTNRPPIRPLFADEADAAEPPDFGPPLDFEAGPDTHEPDFGDPLEFGASGALATANQIGEQRDLRTGQRPGIELTGDRLLDALRATFGHQEFRPLQREVAEAILAGRDVFALMPTGGGKSLCYQLPALLTEGVTVVVSPLIALMKDQVDALIAHGVPAMFINSALDFDEVRRRQAAVARGAVKLLYVAPERLMMPGFLRLLSSVRVSCFAIDEAHCISEWGHDFRLDYRQLRQLRSLFPGTTIAAFTATATGRVQQDIVAQLGLRDPGLFRGTFNRPNLFYEVHPKVQGADHDLIGYVKRWQGQSGIVYCQSRAETERVAMLLHSNGHGAAAYHAGLGPEARKQRQDAFISGRVSIIVATIAFGMGIDKADVRFVVHYDLPKSLEGYAQESGRAGRDGEPSECVLFFSYGAAAKVRYFIDQMESEAQQAIAKQQLQQMLDWAGGTSCRRRALLAYFDEPFAGQPAPCCDTCQSPVALEDWTIPAQMFMSCVKRTGERFGAQHVIDVLRGSSGERIQRLGHDRLSTYGIGKDRTAEEWWHLARQLLAQGHLRRDALQHDALTITEQGNAVLFRGQSLMLAPAPEVRRKRVAKAVLEESDADYDVELYACLVDVRKRLADERGAPAYAVFPDRVLRQLASQRPTTRADLLTVSGVGDYKAAAYGEPFLDEIARYIGVARTEAPIEKVEAPQRRRSTEPGPTVMRTVELFNEGYSPEEIAVSRRLTLRTIEEHLTESIEHGAELNLDRLVDSARRLTIEDHFVELGLDSPLKPVMERLGEGSTYSEVMFVRAALRAQRDRG